MLGLYRAAPAGPIQGSFWIDSTEIITLSG